MLPASLPETRKDGKETGAAETDLEKFESLSLQRFRGQRGERRAQPLFTEAQGLAPPQGRFWEKDNTHTHTHVRTEFQMTQQLRQLHTCCSRRKHSLQAGLKLSEDQNNTKLLLGELRDDEITHAHTRTHTVFLLLQ